MLQAAVLRTFWALAILAGALSAGCAAEAPATGPTAWQGFFHPAPLPGASINNTQLCECRACDPSNCCGGEQTENSGTAPSECTNPDNYEFSDKCGIKVETCTPRCYSQVWRVGKLESCGTSRPLVCCD